MEWEMVTHSSVPAWKIEEPGRLQSMAPKESDTTEQWRLSKVFFLLPLWGQCHTSAWKPRIQWVQRVPHDLDAYSFSVVSLQIKKASCSKKWKGFKLQREFWVMGSCVGGALEIWPNSIAKYLTSSSINWKLWIDLNSDYSLQPHPHSWDSTGI